jgi:hypothetical protein
MAREVLCQSLHHNLFVLIVDMKHETHGKYVLGGMQRATQKYRAVNVKKIFMLHAMLPSHIQRKR